MSKRMTRVLSMLLTLVMFLSLPSPAFAWGGVDIGSGWDREIGDDEVRDFNEPVPEESSEEPTVAFQMEDEATGLRVDVEAPQGALPTLAELRVEQVLIEDVQDAVNEVVDGEPEILLALDISFWLDEHEIEPEEPVRVKISAPELEGQSNMTLVHIPDEEEPATVDLIPQEDLAFELGTDEIVFEAESFSVYAVVGESTADENARLQVRFFHHDNDTVPVYSVYVTKRDVEILGNIIEDPQIPTNLTGNQLFCGWYVGTDYTAADVDGQHTIDYIRGEVKSYLQTHDIHEGDTLDVYAMIFNYYNVAYVDENGETTLATEVYYNKETTLTVDVQMSYAPYLQGYRFVGWQKDDGDDTVYENGDTAEVTQKVTRFRAQVQQGSWLSFEENPGDHYKGATYVPPVFCPNGVIPANAMPEDPVLNGYTLGGTDGGKWYLKYDDNGTADVKDDVWTDNNFQNNAFSFTGTIDHDTTVYAKWQLKDTVPVTVIIWTQNVDDAKNAADNDKKYDFYSSHTMQAEPNKAVSELDLSDYMYTDWTGFTYNTTKGVVSSSTTVKPDGTTVINLYYDRVLCTYTFYTPNGFQAVSSPDWTSGRPDYYVAGPDGNAYMVNFRYNNECYYLVSYNTSVSYRSYYTFYTVVNSTIYTLKWSTDYNTWYYTSGGNYWYDDGDFDEIYGKANSSATIYERKYTIDSSRTITGLYGQTLTQNGYSWKTDYRWFDGPHTTSFQSVVYTFRQSYNSPAPTGEPYLSKFYGEQENLNAHVYHFLQNEDGTWTKNSLATSQINSLTNALADYDIPTGLGDGMAFRGFFGFKSYKVRVALPSGVTQYKIVTGITDNGRDADPRYTYTYGATKTSTNGWTEWLDPNTTVQIEASDKTYVTSKVYQIPATPGGIQFLYEREQFQISYMYGAFIDGRGNPLPSVKAGPVKDSDGNDVKSDPIYYQGSIDSYAEGKANYFDPSSNLGDDSYVFEGWYVDPGCTTKYDFTGKTMPYEGVTVYAKFRQREFRVFLHPNLPDGVVTSLADGASGDRVDWVDPQQAMNFRVAYQDVISDGEPVEGSIYAVQNAGASETKTVSYVLVGWYTDPECTQPFKFDTKFTDAMGDLAKTYGAAEKADPRYATEADGTNTDVDRPWIDKMVHIYAKWRPVLPGSTGITVVYNAVEEAGKTGTFTVVENGTQSTVTTVTDPLRYTPNSDALSHAASTPDSNQQQFLYWEILKNDGTPSGKIVYPGMTFTVDAQYAVVTDVNNGNAVTPVLPRENLSALRDGEAAGLLATGQTYYEPVNTITAGEEYLIGVVYNGKTYLLMNYSPDDDNHYYWEHSNSTSYPDDWAYGIPAVLEDGNVVDLDNTSYGTATFDHVTWKFVQNGSYYRIQSGYNSSYYLNIYNKNYNWSDCYPKSDNTANTSGFWRYTNNKLVFNNGSVTKYLTYQGGNVSTYCFFSATTSGTNVQLYRKVAIQNYTVTFKDHDGTVLSQQVVQSGSAATAPADPEREGYHFTGWDKAFNNVTGDLVVTATYAINTYTVTFKDYDDSTLETQTVEHGGYATAPAENPTREGYTFTGWDPNPTTTAITSDLTITAQYRREGFFIVTFKDWNGRVLKTEEVERGKDATAPETNPKRKGYTFTGWDKDFTKVQSNLVVYATYATAVTKIYTVTLRAHYGPRTQQEKTHITWYANNGTGKFMNSEGVYMNENISIPVPEKTNIQKHYVPWAPDVDVEGKPVPTDLVWEDHVFLGWARVMESDAEGNPIWKNTAGNNDPSKHPIELELGEADLFLKYDPANKTFTANQNAPSVVVNADGTTSVVPDTRAGSEPSFVDVDYVAADELLPYHAMYAVWGKVVYVYHTGTGVVERIVVDTKATPTIDVANRTSEGFLYGGYYKNYSGVGTAVADKPVEFDTQSTTLTWQSLETFRMANPTLMPNQTNDMQAEAAKGWVSFTTDTGCTKYDGVNISWNSANAYGTVEGKANGLNVAPVAGTTYYIKEVPAAKYLQPYFHYTYKKVDGNPIVTAWLISDLDDQNYTESGFVIVDANGKAKICSSLTVQNAVGGNTIKLTAKRIFGVDGSGLLTYRRVIENYAGINGFGDGAKILQYWVTPDGLIVTGTTSRVYTGTAGKTDISCTPTPEKSTIALFGNNSLAVPPENVY